MDKEYLLLCYGVECDEQKCATSRHSHMVIITITIATQKALAIYMNSIFGLDFVSITQLSPVGEFNLLNSRVVPCDKPYSGNSLRSFSSSLYFHNPYPFGGRSERPLESSDDKRRS